MSVAFVPSPSHCGTADCSTIEHGRVRQQGHHPPAHNGTCGRPVLTINPLLCDSDVADTDAVSSPSSGSPPTQRNSERGVSDGEPLTLRAIRNS